jgi:hypothetical protein
MCKMDELPRRSAPLRCVMIFSICLGVMLVHFFAESFEFMTGQSTAMEWIEHGEKGDPTHAAGEDSFVFPISVRLEIPQACVRAVCPDSPAYSSLASLPLLPPPIAG